MANAVYPKGLEGFLSGAISWTNDTIRCMIVTSGYTPNLSTDQYYSDVSTSDIIASSAVLGSKTATLGVANAATATFTAPPSGTGAKVVIYQDTGVVSTSRLIAVIDTAGGLPVTTNGSDNVVITWDSGANKIFTL